eukprot:Gb_04939 [translate_table: standard]
MLYSSVKMWPKAYCILGAAFLAVLLFQTAVATSRDPAKAEKDGTAHIFSASRSLLQIGLVPGFPSLGPPIIGNIGPPSIGIGPPTLPTIPSIPSLLQPPAAGTLPSSPAIPSIPSVQQPPRLPFPFIIPPPIGAH